ncbi:hypothetical protein [Paraburkholderia caledonica]|uniref:Small lipoprotein YifL n=1 Tax=Paraburkholderia caledonica TaxID=134536 RepID=A0AB73IP77_9BURK|nr:putative small lipoprotein YifL [Paraburkholderia caledonica]
MDEVVKPLVIEQFKLVVMDVENQRDCGLKDPLHLLPRSAVAEDSKAPSGVYYIIAQ